MEPWLKDWLQPHVLILLLGTIASIAGTWRAISIRLDALEEQIRAIEADIRTILGRKASPWVVEQLNDLDRRMKLREDASQGGFQRLAVVEERTAEVKARQEEILRRLDAIRDAAIARRRAT